MKTIVLKYTDLCATFSLDKYISLMHIFKCNDVFYFALGGVAKFNDHRRMRATHIDLSILAYILFKPGF